ncbi:MAG: hypothetical protein KME26_12675 [Oscillatoria princeps RMCB-10]|nr:hypothetical protein [Oscillatoria princeps RMCB-10]
MSVRIISPLCAVGAASEATGAQLSRDLRTTVKETGFLFLDRGLKVKTAG